MSAVESLGKYAIRRQLGRGAMGTVYEGFDPIIERVVAIKTVRLPEADDADTVEEIARFRREAQAAGRLTHPNIVGVFDYGETADLAYIVMEYVDGPPLKNLLDKQERFPLPRIVQIMEDLLAGLQFSHDRGVVHRDIKPANLMLTKSGQAKIADFGIARIESSSMTQAGTVLGTPAYMSPEQFMGQVVDARSDIYSSGVLLYQLLTGERPFEGGMSAIMHKALNTEASPPSQISVTAPRGFDAVVRKAMAKRPEDRYASAAEFMAAIRAAAAAPAMPAAEEEEEGDSEATVISAPRPAGGSAGRSSTSGAGPRSAQIAGMAASGVAMGGMTASGMAAGSVATGNMATGGTAPSGGGGIAAPGSGKSSSVPLIIGGGVAGLAVLGGIGYFLFAGNTPSPEPTKPTAPVSQPSTPSPVTPPTNTAPPPVTTPPTTTAPPPVTVPRTEQPVTPPVTSTPPVTQPPVQPPVTQPPVQPPVTQTPPVQPPVTLAPTPTTPVSPVLPPSTQAPTDPLEATRAELAAFVARLPCSLLDGDARDGTVEVSGIGGRPSLDSLRQKLSAMGLTSPAPTLRVTQVDQSFCPWEDLLRPIAKPFGATSAGLTMHLPGDPAYLVKDDFIRPRLAMGEFRGAIVVDYLDRQGNVQHLYPQQADPKQHMAGDPPHVFNPGEDLSLGDPGPDRPGWQVDEPYGTDVIIAVASEDPLFDRPRPGNVEKAANYLRELKRAVEAGRSRGERITGTAISVETRLR